ncbi:hypothetical protein SAMN05444422_102460 [Halobiforma haloterrestris]|uniref:Uncharacterized protein n=1 Tax=Natronobacterium haloterrestre TaxID=148448 RepID=A0A1I1EIP5_NATHA|nr:hypothetical protein SAMN05444422_102460 [Halobiforma haloterrestris]
MPTFAESPVYRRGSYDHDHDYDRVLALESKPNHSQAPLENSAALDGGEPR